MSRASENSVKVHAHLGMLARTTETLPRLMDIASQCGIFDAHDVYMAFDRLERLRHIRRWHGTRSQYRGEQSILIMATGQRLRTAGCPAGVDPVDTVCRVSP
jgi:hypothetical protein